MEAKSKTLFENNDLGKVLYIRHGQTEFNFLSKKYSEELVKHNIEFLDCPLNEGGKSQALDLRGKVNNYKIQKVFCSPMHRCLETCQLSLKDHPEKENFAIVIHPLITEAVHCVHDFSIRMSEKKAFYNKENTGLNFDWSEFESLYPNILDQEIFFMKFMDNLEQDEEGEFHQIFSNLRNEEHYQSKNYKILDESLQQLSKLANNKDLRPESLKYLFNRNLKFKEFLELEKLKDNNVNNEEKILVYTHSNFIKISTSVKAYDMNSIEKFPDDSNIIKNCEIITMK
jgi:bisphosphoglycerate-dependent phosphoglycerate mutase